MAIRWRRKGQLICAAMSEPEQGDTYIDDRLAYELTVIQKIIVADENHKENGLWRWAKRKLKECVHVQEVLCYEDITCTISCGMHPKNPNKSEFNEKDEDK